MATIPSGTKFLGLDSSVPTPELNGSTINKKTQHYTIEDIVGSVSSGLEGSSYIYVAANGTDVENAEELQNAYDLAKTMSPTADNRITVIAAPGNYKFPSTFVMDTEYIDLVSLTGNADLVFDLEGITEPFSYSDTPSFYYIISECISIETDNIYLKGVKGKLYDSPEYASWFGIWSSEYVLPIWLDGDFPNIVVENCEGGFLSFGGDKTEGSNPPINVSGKYINCKIPNSYGFGAYFSGNANGYFKDCYVEYSGFGHYSATGTFINCVGGIYSFGRSDANGTFIDCVGGDFSFSQNAANGTFINCVSGISSFGGNGTSTGTFTNCISESYGFSSNGNANGRYINCEGDVGSFGYFGSLTGKLFYCTLKAGTFQTVSGSGRTYYCVDGNGNTNNQ